MPSPRLLRMTRSKRSNRIDENREGNSKAVVRHGQSVLTKADISVLRSPNQPTQVEYVVVRRKSFSLDFLYDALPEKYQSCLAQVSYTP